MGEYVTLLGAEDVRSGGNAIRAIAEVPTRDALPGTVVGEVERGYKRRGKLLRAAKVAVAVEPKEES